MKKKKKKFCKKTINVDTLSINAKKTSRIFGVHAPDEVDVTKLKRKNSSFISR